MEISKPDLQAELEKYKEVLRIVLPDGRVTVFEDFNVALGFLELRRLCGYRASKVRLNTIVDMRAPKGGVLSYLEIDNLEDCMDEEEEKHYNESRDFIAETLKVNGPFADKKVVRLTDISSTSAAVQALLNAQYQHNMQLAAQSQQNSHYRPL